MKKIAIVSVVAALAAGAGLLAAHDPPDTAPKMPGPAPEHRWLQQGVGEWESVSTMCAEPGKTPVESKGSERVRAIGEFWIVGEGQATVFGMPFTTVITLGYDPEKKKFVGTWIDSVSPYLWHYEGTLDATGRILTLETQGPRPDDPSQHTRYKEVTEYKSNDHRVFTSSILGEDGMWTTLVTVDSRRRKP